MIPNEKYKGINSRVPKTQESQEHVNIWGEAKLGEHNHIIDTPMSQFTSPLF